MKITVTKELEFSDKRIKDLLCGAFEGGSNYWIGSAVRDNPDDIECEYLHDVPLTERGGVIIQDMFGDEGPKRVDRTTIRKGLEYMRDKFPKHLETFWTANDDAETSDVFLQCCCFGQVVYG